MTDYNNRLDSTLPETWHKRGHRGQVFVASAVANIGAGSTLTVLIIPGSKSLHLGITVACNGELDFIAYSDTTFSDAGTPVDIVNVNFGSPIVNTASVNIGATITDIGNARYNKLITPVETHIIPARVEEFIFVSGMNYAFQLINDGLSTVRYSADVGWYEP